MSPNVRQSPVPSHPPDRSLVSWHTLVHQALVDLGGEAKLAVLYGVIGRHPRAGAHEHWRDKVRQRLQASRDFVRTAPGTWALSAKYSSEEIARFEDARRKRYPRRARFTEG